MSVTHGVVGRHQCEVCKKYFHILDEYKKCVRSHTGEKPYKCEVEGCGKGFSNTSGRASHLLSHGEENSVSCSQCSDTFRSTRHLKQHIANLHEGKGKVPCPDCGKVIANSGNLKNHRRLHTGEKPFKCSVCVKTFADGSAHKRHKITHKDIEDRSVFKCKQCNESFKSHQNLYYHTNKEHIKDVKRCEICDYKTFIATNLKYHFDRRHGRKEDQNETIQCPDCNENVRKSGFAKHKRKQMQINLYVLFVTKGFLPNIS